MPDPNDGGTTSLPAGTPHVVLLRAQQEQAGRAYSDVIATEIRVGTGTPVVWRQADSLGGGTDAGQMGIAGLAALERLAKVRSFDESIDEIDETAHWITPCLRFTMNKGDAAAAGIMVNLTGDGGWPGAVGYDDAGRPVDVVISTTLVPWSLFGLPGSPPPETIADEPKS